jgi:N-acetylmuramic acid 6-phosphate etherase
MTTPDLEGLTTESPNANSVDLDRLTPTALVQLMYEEDRQIAAAMAPALPALAAAVAAITERMRRGGRLVYCGAGTSGRLGVLDAVECRPTFSAADGQVIGLIAGGERAFVRAVEGAEDSAEQGAMDLREIGIGADDCVVGIAASGRTPYVIGALQTAQAAGAYTAAVVCNAGSAVAAAAEQPIEIIVGPEVLTGSTRLKAGTATKMALNMLSTGAFVGLGKAYGNLMVDLQATNAKLVERSIRIVVAATGRARAEAEAALAECDGRSKAAIVMLLCDLSAADAKARLADSKGHVRDALERQQ